jgi:hypothetical protein
VATDEHARPAHGAAVDQVAHGDVVEVRGSEVADRRHPARQRPAGVLLGEEDVHGGQAVRLAQWRDLGGGVVVVRHVGVGVDQSGDAREAAQVDHLGAPRRAGLAGLDLRNAVPRDGDGRARPDSPRPVHEPPEPDHPDFCLGGAARPGPAAEGGGGRGGRGQGEHGAEQ